jgi:ATP-dependent Clp protease adaptor protein ClpS
LLQYASMSPIVCGTVKTPETREITDIGTGNDFEAEVVVFNCDCHTYQQVVDLFCQVIPGMTPPKAFELAWRIDHHGSAIVFQGDIKNADIIGKKLADGGLRVEVRY